MEDKLRKSWFQRILSSSPEAITKPDVLGSQQSFQENQTSLVNTGESRMSVITPQEVIADLAEQTPPEDMEQAIRAAEAVHRASLPLGHVTNILGEKHGQTFRSSGAFPMKERDASSPIGEIAVSPDGNTVQAYQFRESSKPVKLLPERLDFASEANEPPVVELEEALPENVTKFPGSSTNLIVTGNQIITAPTGSSRRRTVLEIIQIRAKRLNQLEEEKKELEDAA